MTLPSSIELSIEYEQHLPDPYLNR
jgi:hypothetical protein